MALKAGRVGVRNDQVDVHGKILGDEPYVLPTASYETLGGVKVGNGLAIDDGVLSASSVGGTDLYAVTICNGSNMYLYVLLPFNPSTVADIASYLYTKGFTANNKGYTASGKNGSAVVICIYSETGTDLKVYQANSDSYAFTSVPLTNSIKI